MISNQILQSTIDGLKGITRIDLCIIDTEGKVMATTFQDSEGFVGPAIAFMESPADSQVVSGCQFFKVFDEHQLEYVLIVNGDSDDVKFSSAGTFFFPSFFDIVPGEVCDRHHSPDSAVSSGSSVFSSPR